MFVCVCTHLPELCMCAVCMDAGACGIQNWVSDPLELEIQRLDNSHMGARNLPLPPPHPLQNH